MKAEGDWEKLRDQMRADHQKELDKRDQRIQELEKANDSNLVNQSISEAMKEARIAPQFADTVEAFLRTKIVLAGAGEERKPLVGDNTPAEFLKDYVGSDNGKHYVLADQNTGGGAPGGGRPGATGKNPFDPKAPNITEQMALMKKDPKLAQQLKAQATGS